MPRTLAALHGIDTQAKRLATAQAEIHSLDHSLLAKAFRGEFVPQDPNDEPAEQLLARIRAEASRTSRKCE